MYESQDVSEGTYNSLQFGKAIEGKEVVLAFGDHCNCDLANLGQPLGSSPPQL
ncbi:hypothetical protein GEV33_006904 [Tenebrio molitor]|uniref:Uncharacterized protein n=1 Tax=Tenebrio molitor TaxID=7067 RepID=A0A8J6LCT7_TENMO|nr:hypothetical protein GEV33_006904 [Tenebrio molitor]